MTHEYEKENNELTTVVVMGLRTNESDEEFDYSMKELVSLCEACDLDVA